MTFDEFQEKFDAAFERIAPTILTESPDDDSEGDDDGKLAASVCAHTVSALDVPLFLIADPHFFAIILACTRMGIEAGRQGWSHSEID